MPPDTIPEKEPMSRQNRFAVLLITDNKGPLETIIRLIKRHFSCFYLACSPEQAVEVINSKGIDVVLFGYGDVQEAEVCFLHMIRNDRTIEDKISSTMVLCSKEQVQNAFNICNKDIFNDYFIVKPLYDPHHILLRLRTLRRLLSTNSLKQSKSMSVDEMCSFFDQVATSGQELVDLNQESLERLMATVTFSMESMKERMRNEQPNNPNLCAQTVNAIIDDHATNTLMPQLQGEKQDASESVNSLVSDLVTQTENNKSSLQNEIKQNQPSAVSIMIIEDEEQELMRLATYLEETGYSPNVSTHATHALKMLEQWQPRIVLVDLTLPDMSALHVISRIQNHPKLQNTKIMALAKQGDKDKVMEAVKMGINEVMMKPVDKDMLMYKINYNLTSG